MSTKFSKARFHVSSGPRSLFERVMYVMSSVRTLGLHGRHFQQRVLEREIPSEVLSALVDFTVDAWDLVTAEVRSDTGKFVNSTWGRSFGSDVFWVTIGLGNTVETVFLKDKPDSYSYVTAGSLFDLVEAVNRELMGQER